MRPRVKLLSPLIVRVQVGYWSVWTQLRRFGYRRVGIWYNFTFIRIIHTRQLEHRTTPPPMSHAVKTRNIWQACRVSWAVSPFSRSSTALQQKTPRALGPNPSLSRTSSINIQEKSVYSRDFDRSIAFSRRLRLRRWIEATHFNSLIAVVNPVRRSTLISYLPATLVIQVEQPARHVCLSVCRTNADFDLVSWQLDTIWFKFGS